MQSIEIRKGVRVEIEELITGVSSMETPVLEKFLDTLNHILDNRKVEATGREQELLKKIENLIPSFVKRRYSLLYTKLQKDNISEEERQELQQIIHFMEERAVERIHLMAQLAALRNISLKELAEDFRQKRYANAKA